ncbi:hypothetical protein Fmac_011247 [Flemingia macrophylla]|uniref:Uncharacterized protein n=1 Tax=Flemingia macrophylla TaxID=520843 RepID=A0ABD1MLW3_9FABA
MQKSYNKTFKRQRAALGKKHSTSTFIKRSKVKYLRTSNLRRRRNFKNATKNPEPSRNMGNALPIIFEEKETEVVSYTSEVEEEGESNTSEEAQSPPHDVTNMVAITNRTNEIVPELQLINDIHSSFDAFVWGKNGQRSNTRSTAINVATSRSKRLSRLIDHLRSSEQNDDEYVAHKTSLQIEEIELYLVNEFQLNIVNGDGKLDPNNDKLQLLAREEETLAELKENNSLNFGHLVVAYKRKMWNLNEVLPCVE